MLSHLYGRLATLRSGRGATAVEYGIMVALIAVVIILAVYAVGNSLTTVFNGVSGWLGFAGPPPTP